MVSGAACRRARPSAAERQQVGVRWFEAVERASSPNSTSCCSSTVLRYTNADAPVDVPAPGGAKQRSDFHGR